MPASQAGEAGSIPVICFVFEVLCADFARLTALFSFVNYKKAAKNERPADRLIYGRIIQGRNRQADCTLYSNSLSKSESVMLLISGKCNDCKGNCQSKEYDNREEHSTLGP